MSKFLEVVVKWLLNLSTSDWISLVSATATFGAVIFAAWQVKLASDSHKHNQQAQMQSLRPYMVAQLLPPRTHADSGRIGVKNYGKTAARDVSVSFDPELPHLPLDEINANSASSHMHFRIVDILDRVFGKPFSTLAPGQEVESLYWNRRKKYDGYVAPKRIKLSSEDEAANKRREDKERAFFDEENGILSADGFSDKTEVVIKYKDDNGNQYEDRFGLSPAILEGYTFITTSTTSSTRKL